MVERAKARRGELPVEIVSLEDMRKKVEERRAGHLEKCGGGLDEKDYREHVGRAKECAWLLDLIDKRLVIFNREGE